MHRCGAASARSGRGFRPPGSGSVALSLVSRPAPCAEQAIAAFQKLKSDPKISAELLCGYSWAIIIATVVTNCKLERKPVDDAIVRAIATIEAFIVANSTQRVSPDELAQYRRSLGASVPAQGFETAASPGMRCGGRDFERFFRSATAERIDAETAKLLAKPPHPGAVPCGP